MPTVVWQDALDEVCIPEWVGDLASFRRWCRSDEFPERGRIDHVQGTVWVDLTMDQVFPHVHVKTEFTVVLGGLVKRRTWGFVSTMACA